MASRKPQPAPERIRTAFGPLGWDQLIVPRGGELDGVPLRVAHLWIYEVGHTVKVRHAPDLTEIYRYKYLWKYPDGRLEHIYELADRIERTVIEDFSPKTP